MLACHPHITGRNVLVTGAAGSIGAVLCARLLALAPARLVALNLTEAGLVTLERRLHALEHTSTECAYVLGNVTDPALLARWLPGIDTVMHAAAYKYVPVCEHNHAAAVLNNVGGTLAVCQAAQQAGVSRCLLVSTDKAVNPASTMGSTKYVAERLVSGMGPGFLTVRFGNVLDSAGSVLPLWREQIAQGGPVTVTDPGCERYFMSVDEACTLILETLALDVAQGTYVFDMGEARNLLAMAQALIAENGGVCDITITGLRPGDKLTEELYEGERQPTTHPRIFQVPSAPPLLAGALRLELLLGAAHRYDEARTQELLMTLVDPGVAVLPSLADRALPDTALTFVTYKWKGSDPARQFASEHVNVLYAMLARHYHAPFRLVCLTDDPSGLDGAIDAWPLPDTKADLLRAPRHGSNSKLFPACYRRLWLFSEEARALGARICLLDIDVIILSDITALLQRKTADFVAWADTKSSWNKIAGGLWLLTTGSHTDVWTEFCPETSPALAQHAGYRGSDQAWLSYKLYPPQERFTAADGVLKIGWLAKGGRHPKAGTRMIFTTGVRPPWDRALQLGYPWVTQHWRLD